jgi:hypothetical protein
MQHTPSELKNGGVIMGTAEAQRSQDFSSQAISRWRRFTQAWPLFVVILGVVLSFGWTALLVWVVWGLIDLTT